MTRIWSWRWWFEDRTTGRITIAQFPNWPLWAALGASATARVLVEVDAGGIVGDLVGWAARALWLYWAGLEVTSGVNPWRRLLGAGVIVWQVSALLR